MKVAILQFAPQLGAFDKNIARANELLRHLEADDVDLLVLPELAFSGYNFPNYAAIKPFLEPTANGPSAAWARATAARLDCFVSVGYPEIETKQLQTGNSDDTPNDIPVQDSASEPSTSTPRTYNALLTVDAAGALVAHYRKTNLYYTDATWSWPNPDGFKTTDLSLPELVLRPAAPHGAAGAASSPFNQTQTSNPAKPKPSSSSLNETIPTCFAICMDFNPHQFLAPWSAYELSTHVLKTNARLLIASNAWLSSDKPHDDASAEQQDSSAYGAETLAYWVARLKPLVGEQKRRLSASKADPSGAGNGAVTVPDGERQGEERLIVIANRVGVEPGICRACDLSVGRPPEGYDREEEGGGKGEAPPSSAPQGSGSAGVSDATGPGAEPTAAEPADGTAPGAGIVALEVRYAGTSCVLGLKGDGRIGIYGVLGWAEEKVLLVDTAAGPESVASLVSRGEESEDEE